MSLPRLEDALHDGLVVLPPLVAAELLSAQLSKAERRGLLALLEDLPLHPTPFAHWRAVGELRAHFSAQGYSVSTPDAHIAACAIEAGAPLWSKDAIFRKLAKASALQLFNG
ncbi:MAG TPA: PIN domain-containing protein [Polyangiaceae bacterium]|nr:PIN domain-containing protein [Polyangiaceae bacterium]